MVREQKKLIPLLKKTKSNRLIEIEKFSHYVARQIGFKDASEVPVLCILAQDLLRRSKECDENIYEYICSVNGSNAYSLYMNLMDEFERCVNSYLAFHWNQVTHVINLALSVESGHTKKFKKIILAAMRKQRFERENKNIQVTRRLSTSTEEMKAKNGDMDEVIPSERSPILLLIGGGMGAGKSCVLENVLKGALWSREATNAVIVVETNVFSETEIIYMALNSRVHHDDMLQTAELMHQSSTHVALSKLVTALNEGRDVIMNDTLSCESFIKQTIAMARNIHEYQYQMGVGYKVAEDGTVTENYWERLHDTKEENQSKEISNGKPCTKKPYSIALFGVVCDSYLAMVRIIRKAIITRSAVNINSQLKSHKMFANAFPRYCNLVDYARLCCTNVVGRSPNVRV
ncbi:uncharacterized protein LOC114191377 [Vigna unguiculata]|uniref:uncharacterized protein LOC114171990 n=1 Tax=Vigna unguiculata TaxID=3917 RepID=UPI00101654F1|nr:uncharacterized protein LOC114171990 [Vigna unguiculata]XP_027936339.1 uncharacterized protein LOC114191368 [Vigna unguiculata]XP_027936346.1 uncharacterized protein LOC114191377 [Vigna unguiculata]